MIEVVREVAPMVVSFGAFLGFVWLTRPER